MNHDVNDFSNYIIEGPIVIGDNSWLATNCVILPGVVLGPHTIVAAGAVVTKSFEGGDQMLAGVPAKVVKKLFEYRVEEVPDTDQPEYAHDLRGVHSGRSNDE